MFFDRDLVLCIGLFEFEIDSFAFAGQRLHECDAFEMDFRAFAHVREIAAA